VAGSSTTNARGSAATWPELFICHPRYLFLLIGY
jgi:hypothetical protein